MSGDPDPTSGPTAFVVLILVVVGISAGIALHRWKGSATSAGSGRGPNGFLVLVLIVVAGIAASSGFYRWKGSEVRADVERRIAEAPKTPEGLAAAWLEYGAPSIHQCLQTSRISFQQPWLVTHTVVSAEPDGAPAVWGLDLSDVGPEVSRVEGRTIIVSLPAPELLAHTVLIGNNARGVRGYRPDQEPPDASIALREKVEWMLQKLAGGLEKDIEGASIVVEVGEPKTP